MGNNYYTKPEKIENGCEGCYLSKQLTMLKLNWNYKYML